MRVSSLFARTLRDDPAEAEVPSHRLLLRAAFIRKTAAGIYTSMPLGLRTMNKIERIVREEMDAAGSQELRMPIVLPSEPWKATGRYEAYGDLMFRLHDRHDREFILGPTQEEVVAELAQQELPSYRDLPRNVYQVEWKYRDEFRPRYGLLRGREFLMKDAYSLDRDEEGMRASYQVMYDAYVKVFDRLGLDYVIVEADPGQIGGGVNHEFMALADVGEDLFVRCEHGDYLADTEAATPAPPEPAADEEPQPLTEVETPGAVTIELMSEQMGIPAEATMKCILFDVEGRTVAVLVPGDREVNEEKLARAHFPARVRPFEDDDFAERGFAKGFVGPQGLGDDVTIFADPAIRGRVNWATGANRPDVHVTGANLDRDFRVDRWEDLVQFREGDRCPNDGGRLEIARSIVVGHIYQLGTNYSAPLEATFQDEDGTQKPYVMGSYGIGITRIMAATVEQHHDDAGIVWPRHLAPYEVIVIMANADAPEVAREAERIRRELGERGIEAVLDDREERAGVKFADADLVGYPVQVVVGSRGLGAGTVDLKVRATGERSQAPVPEAAAAAEAVLRSTP
ncbi:MAG TPA: proline--tRNA ligase [Actinomycetota bacterium]|nr:proline--tRNA ligase [Actinomycetota bacterium]